MNSETLRTLIGSPSGILIAGALIAGTLIALYYWVTIRRMNRDSKREREEWNRRYSKWMDDMKNAKSQEERDVLYENRPSKQMWGD